MSTTQVYEDTYNVESEHEDGANLASIIDATVEQYSITAYVDEIGLSPALKLAKGMRLLEEKLTDKIMQEIMYLQGSKLGFRTDKDDKGGYDVKTVRHCFIESLLRGARPVGNEWNIIAGNCYLTKEFFIRAMSTMPGLSDLTLEFGVPEYKNGNALVPCTASWSYKGRQDSLTCDKVHDAQGRLLGDNSISVRVNNGMIVDAIYGKAERKMRARIMSRITNTQWSDADVDDSVEVSSAGSQSKNHNSQLKNKLNGNSSKSSKPAKPATVATEFDYRCGADEDPKSYHMRFVDQVLKTSEEAELEQAMACADVALDQKQLNPMRYKDVVEKINQRFGELSKP